MFRLSVTAIFSACAIHYRLNGGFPTPSRSVVSFRTRKCVASVLFDTNHTQPNISKLSVLDKDIQTKFSILPRGFFKDMAATTTSSKVTTVPRPQGTCCVVDGCDGIFHEPRPRFFRFPRLDKHQRLLWTQAVAQHNGTRFQVGFVSFTSSSNRFQTFAVHEVTVPP